MTTKQNNPHVKGGDQDLSDLLEETAAEEARPPCPTQEELQAQLLAETAQEIQRQPQTPTMDPLGRAMLNDAIVADNSKYRDDPTELDLPETNDVGD